MKRYFYFLLIFLIVLAFLNVKIFKNYNCPENCVDVWDDCEEFTQHCQKSGIQQNCPCTCQVCHVYSSLAPMELSTASSPAPITPNGLISEMDQQFTAQERIEFSSGSVQASKNVIFIGEMSGKIDLEKKEVFLNATKEIAAYLNANPGPLTTADQLQFSIATFGNGTIRPIQLQKFFDFDDDLDYLIDNVMCTNDSQVNQTYMTDILMDVYDTVLSNPNQHFLVLLMGQNRIADVSCADKYNKRLADSTAKIFVLDMTGDSLINPYLFKDLTRNDSSKIHGYSNQDVSEVASHYITGEFDRIWNGFDCPEYCVDIWNYCQGFVSSCQDPESGSLIRSKCSCTCQVCSSPPALASTTSSPPTPTPKPSAVNSLMYALRCLPVNLIFVLDSSETIDSKYFNTSFSTFVKVIAAAYPMKGETSGVSSRIGVIQFAGDAKVTFPFIERTRQEFLGTIDESVLKYPFEGTVNISAGLDKAVNELFDQGIGSGDNVMVILMTDGVSTLDIVQTQPSADRVRAYTNFFAGVGIDGINGNGISANLTNLQILLGSTNLAFPDILHAEDSVSGIWPKSRKIYPCPKCKNLVFVGEMTSAIGQHKKEVFLNATKQIAAHLNANPGELMNADQLQFSVVVYGDEPINFIKMQAYNDFISDLDSLIDNVTIENYPNFNGTVMGSILSNLYNLVKPQQMQDYLVFFMGESENILDVKNSSDIAMMLSQTTSKIYILDMTNGDSENDYFFKGLVNNDLSKIYKYSNQSANDLFNYYTTNEFYQVWNKMTCNAPVIIEPLRCLPVNLMFVLDNSQSISNVTYNKDVREFVKNIALGYSMKGEITEPSSRIGIVQFASDATVTYPLIERTRKEFLYTVDSGIYYINQGNSNISRGLDVALYEFQRQRIAPHDNVMFILMTDGVSTLDIVQTKPSANRVHAYTKFFAGVGIDGINGNDIAANVTNLEILLGSINLAFLDIVNAEDKTNGIWLQTRRIYPCPVPACKGAIFIGEMTETIAQERKSVFLNASKQIAAYLNSNPGSSTTANQLQFFIATYANGTLRPIKLQSFSDFNNDLDYLINAMAANNQPNAGQTYTSSILKDLYSIIVTNQWANYLVLFMGQTERILDIQLTEAAVQRVASTSAQIFVLDMTNGFWANDYIFKKLVKNDLTKIYNYSSSQTAADVTNYYVSPSNKFVQIWNKMTC